MSRSDPLGKAARTSHPAEVSSLRGDEPAARDAAPITTGALTTERHAPLFRPPAPLPRREPPDMFSLLAALRTNPLTTWTELHFKELIVAGEGALGRVTVVSDPAAIRHILVDEAARYRKDDLQRRVLAPGLGNGLLTVEGDDWRLQRRTLAPLFSPRNVAGFADTMAECAERVVRRWRRRPGGRVVDMAVEMTRVTLDVLERTIFTHGISRDPDALGRAITRYLEAVGPLDPLDLFGMPDWIPRIGRIRARSAVRFFEEVVKELMANRRALIESGAEAPRDLLTLLLEARDPETGRSLSDLEVGANVATFITAGHETTANTLTWTLYLLSQVPDALARVVAEVEAVAGEGPVGAAHLDRLVWTRAVIDEAMRLYPPVPLLTRAPISDDRIGNLRIPRGSLVTIAPWVLHRHRKLWDEPDAFDPSRFLPERRREIDRFAFLPFGAGPRVCIGASFSLQEAVIILATVVRAVRFELAEGHEIRPVHRITLRPEGGLPMRLSLR